MSKWPEKNMNFFMFLETNALRNILIKMDLTNGDLVHGGGCENTKLLTGC